MLTCALLMPLHRAKKAPAPPLNKPGFSTSADGVAFAPGAGGAGQLVSVTGYSGWDAADVNGCNVLWHDPTEGRYHMFFGDFKAGTHSVYHAIAPALDATAHSSSSSSSSGSAAPPGFVYAGVALAERGRIPNDLKRINGHWVMGLHHNSQQVYTSVVHSNASQSDEPPMRWPNSTMLFTNFDLADLHIVSLGFVVDQASRVLKGALYGAGSTPQLNNNRVFAAWLQRRAIFRGTNNATVLGLGSTAKPHGPASVVLQLADNTTLASSASSLSSTLAGEWYLYDADYVDERNPGTLLAVSERVEVAPGDVWRIAESDAVAEPHSQTA